MSYWMVLKQKSVEDREEESFRSMSYWMVLKRMLKYTFKQ